MPQIIRILQHDFLIEREYLPGHVLDAAEAAALNQMLTENVRANVYHWITKATQGTGVLTLEQQVDLTGRIQRYANRYKFKVRNKTNRLNLLDAAIRELARARAEDWGNRYGYSADSTEVYNKFVELRAHPDIDAEARQIVQHRSQVADAALEEII